jgi:hypothetical protein
MEYRSDGVLDCGAKEAGFSTITPVLQYANMPVLF